MKEVGLDTYGHFSDDIINLQGIFCTENGNIRSAYIYQNTQFCHAHKSGQNSDNSVWLQIYI